MAKVVDRDSGVSCFEIQWRCYVNLKIKKPFEKHEVTS